MTKRSGFFRAGLVAALLASTALPARAEPVSMSIGLTGIIANIIGGAATLGSAASLIGGGLITLAFSAATSLAGALLQKKRSFDAGVGGTTGRVQTGGVVSRSFPLAPSVVTHSLTYHGSFGQDGKTPNAFLVLEFALSDLPVGPEGLIELWVNDAKTAWDPDATPETDGVPVADFFKGGRNHMWIRFYDGTQTTADARMVSLFGSDPDFPYGADHIGHGVANVIVTLRYNREIFGQMPSFKFVVDGTPWYDVRKDSTAGGDGDHRWDDPSTWEVSENPQVQKYNLLRGVRYDGEWFYGGQTISANQLPLSPWSAAMNECDVAIDLDAGGTEPQFRTTGEVRLDMEPADAIKNIDRSCGGKLAEIGGVYKPYVGAAGVAALAITDDDVMSTDSDTFKPFESLAKIVNGANAKYVEPEEGWVAKDAPALRNPAYEALDGGRQNLIDLSLEFAGSGTQVQRVMKAEVESARNERVHILPLPPIARMYEPAIDFVSWTSTRNGYVNKLFAIKTARDAQTLATVLVLVECDPASYNWVPANDERPIALAPNVSRAVPAQEAEDFDVDPWEEVGDDGSARAGVRLSWNGVDQDDVRAVAYQIRHDGETDPFHAGEATDVPRGSKVVTEPLVRATDYQIRGRFVPFSGRDTSWTDWIDVTTPDVRAVANDLGDGIILNRKMAAEAWSQLQSLIDGAQKPNEIAFALTFDTISEISRHLEGRSNNAQAQISENLTVQTGINAAQATYNLTIQAQVDAVDGEIAAAVSIEAMARASADAAEAVLRVAGDASLQTQVTNNHASFTTFQTAQVATNSAQATTNSSVSAVLSSHGSSIAANASDITVVKAQADTLDGTAGAIAGRAITLEASSDDQKQVKTTFKSIAYVAGALMGGWEWLAYMKDGVTNYTKQAGMRLELLGATVAAATSRIIFSVDALYAENPSDPTKYMQLTRIDGSNMPRIRREALEQNQVADDVSISWSQINFNPTPPTSNTVVGTASVLSLPAYTDSRTYKVKTLIAVHASIFLGTVDVQSYGMAVQLKRCAGNATPNPGSDASVGTHRQINFIPVGVTGYYRGTAVITIQDTPAYDANGWKYYFTIVPGDAAALPAANANNVLFAGTGVISLVN